MIRNYLLYKELRDNFLPNVQKGDNYDFFSYYGSVPKLRFSEFNDEWEERYISEVISSKSKKYNPENSDSNYPSIELESLSQDSGELLSTFDSKNQKSIKNVFNTGDVLFGKLRPYLKKYYLADFDGVCSSEIWVLKSSILDSSYLYAFVQSNSFISLTEISSGSKMPRADWNLVSSSLIVYPSNPDERKKIGELIQLINSRIKTQKKIIEQLETLMKASREKVFSQKLRFKDEKGNYFSDWETLNLGNVLIKNSNKNKNLQYLNVQSVSNKYGFINQDEVFQDRRVASVNTSNYYVIEKGHFAYNPSRIDVGSLAYKADDNVSIISPLYISFKANNNLLKDDFLLNWFFTLEFNFQMSNSFEGSVRNTLSYESLSKIKIRFSSIKEQTKVTNFLSSIDKKIKLEKEILTQYENQKKYLLQNLFV